ncbi:RICIN domain-containing protein [Streptomyces sp. 8L]|uniref:RICIN domain-containing protein n=1 Tax=Streptomyces sp. 8L TaxID=2877242 RepID=UPI001CD60C6B|nr:RICIN domain-containing protein [Streptomyces sp. 8L]MCA1222332.1 ricin-type beta-trefoil lectin domain protein [Streptomyces sp. 8L]
MSLWTSLEPASTTVDPGGSTSVRLRLRNTGDVVDEYRFVPVGHLSPWTTVEPQSIRLYPGTTGTVQLTFAPPRTPDATAGPNPYGVQIIPTEHPEATTVPEGNVTITPFSEVRAELVPQTVKGRFRGRPRLAVDNLGNVKLTASIVGNDNSDQISYDIHPANVQVEPGRAAFLKTTLKPRQIIWAGSKQSRPYTLNVQRSGAEPLPVRGTYVQPGILPRWISVLITLLLALIIAFVMLWIAYKPNISTQASEQAAPAGALVPTPSPTETAPAPPPPSPTTEAPAAPSVSADAGGGGGSKKKKPNPYARVLLRNGTTHKCATPQTKGGKTMGKEVQYTCKTPAQDNQLWNIDTVFKGKGPNGRDLVQIRNVDDAYCMDLPNNGPATSGTDVDEWTCTGSQTDNQMWWLEKRPSTGLYWIHNLASDNMCLDVDGYASANDDGQEGKKLGLFKCSDDDDQGWSIDKPDNNQNNQN